MKEIARHTAGKVYLLLLVLSVIGFIVFMALGGTDAPEGGEPIVLFGWMTMPLVSGVVFILFWLVTYLVYFNFYWPYR